MIIHKKRTIKIARINEKICLYCLKPKLNPINKLMYRDKIVSVSLRYLIYSKKKRHIYGLLPSTF